MPENEVAHDTPEHEAAPGNVVPASPELETHLLKKDRRLRIVRIDADSHHGWYVRETPEQALFFSDGGRLDLMGDMLDQAVDHLSGCGLPIYIEDAPEA